MSSVDQDVNFYKTSPDTPSRKAKPKVVINMLPAAAKWYAEHGYYVFPLWPGTKKPATENGLNDATTDLDQVQRWWTENPRYNIGINCGLSGLLVVDGDLYKPDAGNLDDYQVDTVRVDTAHHGAHLWYRMPIGKTYGNGTGTLPKWLDIRGFGGYVVAPPSVLVEDGKKLPYAFAPGCKPTDIDVASLPADIAVILDAAQTNRDAADVHFSAHVGDAPDLSQWSLSREVLELIREGHPPRSDRSAFDQKVITALIYAGATDDQIRAVFVHFPIGAKYQEKKRSGDKYLGRSIGKARAYVEEHSPDAPPSSTLLHDLRTLRCWVQGPELAEMLREHEIARPADYIKTLIAIVNRAISRGAPRVLLGSRQLGELANISHMTAKRHIAMLGDGITINHSDGSVTHRPGLNLLIVTDDPAGYGKWVDLTNLLQTVTPLNISLSMGGCNTSQQFANDHLQDEAFVLYPRHFAVKMRPQAEILPYGLSAAALLIAAVLCECGELTRSAICQLTGLSEYTVGKLLRRMSDMGLLLVWKGKPFRYEVHPNFEGVLDGLRPMLPSYGITDRRGKVSAAARVAYCDRQLEADCRMPEDREKARLRARRARYEKAEADHIAQMEAKGLDPWVKLVDRCDTRTIVEDDLSLLTMEELVSNDPDRPKDAPRTSIKFDAGEEWRSWGRDMWEVWQLLGDDDHQDKIRLLTIAEVGEDADDELYKKVRSYISERVDIALSLANRRVRLERPYWHPEPTEGSPMPSAIPQPALFEVAA